MKQRWNQWYVLLIINQIRFLVGLGVSTETGVATDVLKPTESLMHGSGPPNSQFYESHDDLENARVIFFKAMVVGEETPLLGDGCGTMIFKTRT